MAIEFLVNKVSSVDHFSVVVRNKLVQICGQWDVALCYSYKEFFHLMLKLNTS
jgi:hypothetical protein